MKRFIPIILALSLFLSSCGALGDLGAPAETATPTISVEEIRATADVLVYEMLTQTAAAMPTNTPVPPTETPLPPTATATLVPTVVEPTVDAANVTVAAPTVVAIPTNTMVSSSSATFPCTEKPLTAWDVPSVTMNVTNNVPDSTQAYVFFCITTSDGQAGYITINAGSAAQIPYGYITATAWVSGKKTFNATTGFEVKTSNALQAVIENGQLYIRASCFPGC